MWVDVFVTVISFDPYCHDVISALQVYLPNLTNNIEVLKRESDLLKVTQAVAGSAGIQN